MKRARLRRYGQRIALLCGTLVIMLLLCEAGTRLFSDITQPIIWYDPERGLRFLQSFEGDVFEAEANRAVPIRLHRHGFRGPDLAEAKPEGVRRIAVLGDSMIAGMAVDEEDTLVGRLQDLLQEKHADARWQVMNFGVPGTGTAQALEHYREFVRRYDVDIVVLAFFVGNDLVDNCRRLSREPRLFYDFDDRGELVRLPIKKRRSAVSRWLNRHSRFYVWQKRAIARVFRRNRGRVVLHGIYRTEQSADLAHAWKITEALIARLADDVRSDGVRFALLLLPASEQIYADDLKGTAGPQADAGYPTHRIRLICEARGIAWLPLVETFRVRASESLYLSHGHFTPHGHDLAARELLAFLGRAQLLR